jgi:hypothetical protein
LSGLAVLVLYIAHQTPANNLAHLIARKVGDETHVLRRLVSGKLFLAEIDDVIATDCLAVAQNDKSGDRLTPVFVRHADDRAGSNRFVRRDDVLELFWIDILAALNDHVVLAADQIAEPLFVDTSNVARDVPIAAKHALGLLG